MGDRLCVVMPVYNEQDAIGSVLSKWSAALMALDVDFAIRPYNDGSKDGSLQVMRDFAAAHPDAHVDVRDKPNGGHGNTILTGYRDAAADGFDWIFQVDSDDEMGPERFGELWAKRGDYDFLVGIRDGRVQQLPRKVVSFVSRLCVRLFYGKSVWDVNTPYRLMRTSAFANSYNRIPLTTFAPNVILSGIVARKKFRYYETRVPQHDRTTGEVSIKKWKLLKAAGRSFFQTIWFGLNYPDASRRILGFFVMALAGVSIVKAIIAWAGGPTFDTVSFKMVADGVLSGQSPYVVGRYNYAPVWCYVVTLFRAVCGDGIHTGIVLPVILADAFIVFFLYGRNRAAAWLYLLSPLVILTTGYFRMFDNIAVAFALFGVLKWGEATEKEGFARVWMLSLMIGMSLLVKHVFAFLPIWLAWRERSLRKRLVVLFVPMLIFFASFMFPVASEVIKVGNLPTISMILGCVTNEDNVLASQFPVLAGIIKNVFLYRPGGMVGFSYFWKLIAPCGITQLISSGNLFVLTMVVLSFGVRKLDALGVLCTYLLAVFVFAPGLWTYYLILPAFPFAFLSLKARLMFVIPSLLIVCGRLICLAGHGTHALERICCLFEFAVVLVVLGALLRILLPVVESFVHKVGNVVISIYK